LVVVQVLGTVKHSKAALASRRPGSSGDCRTATLLPPSQIRNELTPTTAVAHHHVGPQHCHTASWPQEISITTTRPGAAR